MTAAFFTHAQSPPFHLADFSNAQTYASLKLFSLIALPNSSQPGQTRFVQHVPSIFSEQCKFQAVSQHVAVVLFITTVKSVSPTAIVHVELRSNAITILVVGMYVLVVPTVAANVALACILASNAQH